MYPNKSLIIEQSQGKNGDIYLMKYKDIIINISDDIQDTPINKKITFLLYTLSFLMQLMLNPDRDIINQIVKNLPIEINLLSSDKIKEWDKYIFDMFKKHGYKEPTEEEIENAREEYLKNNPPQEE